MKGNQGNIIAGAIFFAFFFYITTKGNLPKYMGFLFGTSNAPSTSTPATAASGPGGLQGVINTLTGAANSLLTIAPAL